MPVPPAPTPKESPRGIRPLFEAIFVGAVVFVTAMSGIAYLATEALTVQTQAVKGDLLKMARAAAGLVDGDLHEKLSTSTAPPAETDYRKALAPLVAFHRGVPEIAYLYTLVEKDSEFHFILDTATAADQLGFDREMKPSAFMEPYQSNSAAEDHAEMAALHSGTGYVSAEPFSDEFGTFLTAVAPIKTRDGRTVAIVGLDLDVQDFVHRLARLRTVVLFASGFVFLASLLVGALVFRIRLRLKRQEIAGLLVRKEKRDIEEQNRRLVTALGQIVYHYDVAANHIEWRGECLAILGFRPEEMPADPESWKQRVHPRDTLAMELWTKAKETGQTSLIREYRCLRKDGSPVWVLDRSALTFNAAGGLSCVDGVLLDNSQQKEAEANLIAARDSAEAAGRAKGDFLAVMSHEIRTPMNGVIGCTNLLLETNVDREQKEYLETIRKCGDSLLQLINDILDFSKMDSDKLKLEERPFSLATCVEEILDLYGLMAAEKNIELIGRFIDKDLDWICGDEIRFRQILVNLVGNALKFTSTGEVIVTLQRKPWLPGGSALMLSVKDTGIGIPEDKQQGIFLPFNQGDSSTTRRFGGTGLGLAICGRLATLMGGAITVHSRPGQGAEFVVLIPFVELAERNAPGISGSLRDKTAIVFDDNAAFRLALADLLRSQGLRIAEASDIPSLMAAREAIPAADLLFYDAGLPEATLAELFRLHDGAATKLIELGIPSIQRIRAVFQKPSHAALLKPVRRSALLRLLSGLVSGKDTSSEPSSPESAAEDSMAARFPMKILVVEDNAVNRKVVTQILKRFGYAPEVAENGRACVERLKKESFDMVLMDIQMPEMDGYEATSELRRQGNRTWITALTADAMPDDPLRCRVAGMNDYLSKPIRSGTLRAALERCALARKK